MDGCKVAWMTILQGVKKKGFENLWKSWFPIQEPHLIHFYTWTFSWWLLFFDHFVEVLCYLYLCNVFLEMLQCLKKVTLQLDLHFRNRTRSQQGKYDKYSRLEIKFVLVQGKKQNFQLALCWHRMVVWHILHVWSILNDRMLLVSLCAWNSVSRLGKGGLFNCQLHGHSRRPSFESAMMLYTKLMSGWKRIQSLLAAQVWGFLSTLCFCIPFLC